MQRLLLFTLLLLVHFQISAQFSPENSLIFGGNSLDEPIVLAPNADSTILFLGLRSFSTDGDVPGTNGGTDYWIMKRNINGSLIWNKNFGGFNNDDIRSVMPLPDGGTLAFGTTRNDQGDFGELNGLAGGWLMRTNAAGTLVSGKIFGGEIAETGIDAARSINGDITMAMEVSSPEVDGQANHGFLDVWILRVDNNYNLKFSVVLGGTRQESPAAIFNDINGNTYVAATSYSDLPGLPENNGEADVWVFKINAAGNVVWQKNFGGSEDDVATDIIFGPNGDIYVTAHSNSIDGDFDRNYGQEDVWILQLNPDNGDLGIIKNYGGSGNDVNPNITSMGNQLVISATTDSDSNNVSGNKGFNDVWLFTTDLNGNITNQMNYGGSLNDVAGDLIVLDSVIYMLNGSTSTDKNVPPNLISQQDIWFFTLDANAPPCSDEFECRTDTLLSNELFPPAEDVLVCVGGCNTGLPVGPSFLQGGCGNFVNATAYYKLTTDTTADLLTLSVTSNEFNKPKLALLRTGDCNTFTSVECKVGENGSVLIQYIAVDPLTTYIIAVSDSEGNEGDFELCATSIDVEFCNQKDTLYVKSTSLGSPLSGPFKPGEEVTFCYELQKWNKIDCNGLQGIVPTFGPAWDESGFDFFGMPLQVDSMLVPTAPIGFWDWYGQGDVRYNIANPISGFDGNQGMPPGWYFTNTSDPPPNSDPDETTGDIFTCLLTPSKWKVCWTMPTEDECLSNLDATVSVRTFSDGELGVNTSLACAYDQKQTLPLGMICCLNPTVQPVQDMFICSGDTVILFPETNIFPPYTYTWSADPDVGIEGASAGSERNRFFQVLRNETSNVLQVNYILYASAAFCEADPIVFTVNVRPTPTSNLTSTGPTIVCAGDSITLNFENVGNPPFVFELLRDNEFFANILSDAGLSLSIKIDPQLSGRFKIGSMQDAFCDGEGTGFVNVTVKPNGVTVLDTSVCEGGSVTLGTETFTEAGSYEIVFDEAAENNCDSIILLALHIIPPVNEFITEQICGNDTVFVLGVPYTETIQTIIEYIGPSGCTDYIHLNLTAQDTITDEVNQTICAGDTLNFNGVDIYEEGTYSHVEEIEPGCYSELILDLNVLPEIKVNDVEIIGDAGNSSGAILLELTGGSPPFTYLWSTGQMTESLFNIPHGLYSISVTDQQGCSATFNFAVTLTSSEDIEADNKSFKVLPTLVNRGEDVFIIPQNTSVSPLKELSWWTMNGIHLRSDIITGTPGERKKITIPFEIAPGTYFLRCKSDDGSSAWQRIIVL